MKKWIILLACMLLTLSACAPKFNQEEQVVQETDNKKQKAIIPKYNISNSYYRTILPFQPGEARGLVVENVNTRLDMDEFELGLMRIAQEKFSPSQYLFQQGQYLDRKTIESWLKRKQGNGEGLNPALGNEGTNAEKNKKSPLYISHILEHNYLVKTGNDKVKLGGVVIGLAMNSVHYYETEEGYPREVKISKSDMEKEGKKAAAEIVSRLRQIDGLKEVPIVVGLFEQQPKSSIVPGHFFAVGYVDKGGNDIQDWEKINEEYYVFPSDEAEKNHRDDLVKFLNLKSDIEEFFPNYTGVIGRAFYRDDQLQQLTIDIVMQFYGKTEVIGFTQYVTGLLMEKMPDYMPISVYISSVRGPESIIIKNPDQNEPFVHIYQP
ncbi:CamS family sex pheromone protein [Anoxybacillus flavithermus]|uniref:CamS family sex pheromone protein n=1 Tax=Anoxybacillus flavithermus TaxID=33934 RepID=UPI001867437D|nr:CamS family sex pheromone protein [Anoxybacillus flavithermus]MBE2913735.1 CamS family sex pheromone protein [Anoxybacillus flavithermus]